MRVTAHKNFRCVFLAFASLVFVHFRVGRMLKDSLEFRYVARSLCVRSSVKLSKSFILPKPCTLNPKPLHPQTLKPLNP